MNPNQASQDKFLRPATALELHNVEDIVKMVSTAPTKQPSLFYYEKDGKSYYISFIVMPGYYEFQGIPLLIFTLAKNPPNGSFLKYDLRQDAKEQITFVNGINEREINTGFVQYIPLIKVKHLPDFMKDAFL